MGATPVGRNETSVATRQTRKISHDINIFHCVTTPVLSHYCILVSQGLLGKFEIGDSRIFHIPGSPGCEHGRNIPKETRHTQYLKKGYFIMESEGFWGLLFFPQDKTVRFPLSKCHSSNVRFKSHSPDQKQSKFETPISTLRLIVVTER